MKVESDELHTLIFFLQTPLCLFQHERKMFRDPDDLKDK